MSRKKTAIIKNIRDFEKQRQQTLSKLFDWVHSRFVGNFEVGIDNGLFF